MKHNVHIYATVRVKISGVEALSHADAILKAEAAVNLADLLDNEGINRPLAEGMVLVDAEYAEETTAFLVDEEGDDEFLRTRWYKEPGVLL